MSQAVQETIISTGASGYGWAPTLDRLIAEIEATEFELATYGQSDAAAQRRDSGSYYTPADVADHVWNQFARFHHIRNANDLRALISKTHFVEPSAGSGIFIFTLIRRALANGLAPSEISGLRFTVIDINFAALQFISRKLKEVEGAIGVELSGVGLIQRDFLDWADCMKFDDVAFVGNPPFVANPKGSRWRNLFADFVEAMLDYPANRKSISLILPISVCFSRDYAVLRKKIDNANLGISASSYDNIPDSLFKHGKPESKNSNRANSQRCTILNLGGPDPGRRESSSMRRWTKIQRADVLSSDPDYQCYRNYKFDEQIPRPSSNWILDYLKKRQGEIPLRDLIDRSAHPEFGVAAVARNFIGLRDCVDESKTGVIPIKISSDKDRLVLIQILGSSIFYEYWRSLGDGFHVTSDLINNFPIDPKLYKICIENVDRARVIWDNRHLVLKSKLNSGKVIQSYDFREKFDYVSRFMSE